MAGVVKEIYRPPSYQPGMAINYQCMTCGQEFLSNNPRLKDCPHCTRKPEPEIWTPSDITDVVSRGGITLLPKWERIPDTYKGGSKWAMLAKDWYVNGLNHVTFKLKPGIDQEKALLHIQAIFAAPSLRPEHKVAGAAYLLAQWFEDFTHEPGRR